MSGFFPRRSTLLATVVAAAGFGALGFASIGLGAVIVGETRRIDLGQKAAPGIDAMKAQYKRPATIPFPKENPYTPEKAALGKKLYFDTRLSVTSAQSCASCHSPGFGWGDGLAVGVGHGMAKLGRHSPTIVNAAWGAIFMWDGRLATLEEQALGPIQAAGEMNMPLEKLMERLRHLPRDYRGGILRHRESCWPLSTNCSRQRLPATLIHSKSCGKTSRRAASARTKCSWAA